MAEASDYIGTGFYPFEKIWKRWKDGSIIIDVPGSAGQRGRPGAETPRSYEYEAQGPPPSSRQEPSGAQAQVPTQRKAFVEDPNGPTLDPKTGKRYREATPQEQAAAGVFTEGPRMGQRGARPGPSGILKEHWLNPQMGRATPYEPGQRTASTVEWVDENLTAIDPPAAQAFWDTVEANPRTRAFVDKMKEYDTGLERQAAQEVGVSGKDLDTPEKILDILRYDVEVLRPALRDTFERRGLTDVPLPEHRFGWGEDIAKEVPLPKRPDGGGPGWVQTGRAKPAVVEWAIFGTKAESDRARFWLRAEVGRLNGRAAKAKTDGEKTAFLRGAQANQKILDDTELLREMDAITRGEAMAPKGDDFSATMDADLARGRATDMAEQAALRATPQQIQDYLDLPPPPPPRPGEPTVRLYRGDPVRAGEVAEWGDMGLSGGPTRDPVYQMEMGGPMRGRWWTSSLFTANQYAGGGPVSFVDVPRSIADYYHGQRVATWRRRGDKVLIPEDEYLLPPEYTVGRREVDAINRGEAMVPGAAPVETQAPLPRGALPGRGPGPARVAPYEADLFHGSGEEGSLDVLLSRSPRAQWTNGASKLGVFFTPSQKEAKYFASSGPVYRARVRLNHPYEMTKEAMEGLYPPSATDRAIALRARLESEGHDGIVVRETNGEVTEVVSFRDVVPGERFSDLPMWWDTKGWAARESTGTPSSTDPLAPPGALPGQGPITATTKTPGGNLIAPEPKLTRGGEAYVVVESGGRQRNFVVVEHNKPDGTPFWITAETLGEGSWNSLGAEYLPTRADAIASADIALSARTGEQIGHRKRAWREWSLGQLDAGGDKLRVFADPTGAPDGSGRPFWWIGPEARTTIDLIEKEARARKATIGPWVIDHDNGIVHARYEQPPPGALPGQGPNLAGEALNLAEKLPGPKVRVADAPEAVEEFDAADRLFNAGDITAPERAIMKQRVTYAREEMTAADALDLIKAQYGEEEGIRVWANILTKEKFGERGLPSKAPLIRLARKLDTVFNASKEMIQFNPITGGRGIGGDVITDSYVMAFNHPLAAAKSAAAPVRGLFELARAKRGGPVGDIARVARAVRDGDPSLMNQMDELSWLRQSGEVIPPSLLPKAGMHRADVAGPGLASKTSPYADQMLIAQGAKKLIGEGRIRNVVVGTLLGPFASKHIRDYRFYMNDHRKLVLFADTGRSAYGEARGAWEQLVRQRATKAGASADQWIADTYAAANRRVRESGETWDGYSFSPEDVRAGTGNEDLARTWKNELTTLKGKGKAEADRLLFSYRRTNADEALARATFFHYWQSRALVLHTRMALKNPWLLASYWRFWQGLHDRAAEEGYPDSVLGYTRFMGDTAGFYGLFNPLGVIVPFTMFADAAHRDDAPFWEKIGVFINPWIEGAAAAFGMTENVPDVTGTWSPRNFARMVFNWGNAHGVDWMPGGDAPAEDFLRNVEKKVYETVNAALQGIDIPAREFAPYDPMTAEQTQLRDRALQLAQEGGATPEQTRDALLRIEAGNTNGNPYAEQAWDDFTDAQMGVGLAGLLIPGGARRVSGPLTERRRARDAAYETLDTDGKMTEEGRRAIDEMALINAGSPEAISLESEQQGYQGIGTPRQKALADGWRQIAFGEVGADIPGDWMFKIGNREIPAYRLVRMNEEERKILADQWVVSWNGAAEYQSYRKERDAYVASHPEYQGYDRYTDMIRQSEGGAHAFRLRAERDHPEFSDELTQKRRFLEESGKRGAVLEKELDEWTMSTAGYNAFRGVRQSLYDEEPQRAYEPTADPYGGSWSQGASGGNAQTYSRASSLKKAYAEYSAKMAAAIDIIGDDATRLSPVMRTAYENAGVLPRMSEGVERYLMWAESQPQGSDTSIDAYVNYLELLEAQSPAA